MANETRVRAVILNRDKGDEQVVQCLFNPKDGEQYGWNPSRSTAVTVAAWAVQWLYAYYTWRSTGQWPGIEERVDPNTPLPPRGRR